MSINRKKQPKKYKAARFRLAQVVDGGPEHVFDMDSENPYVTSCGLTDWQGTLGHRNIFPKAHHDTAIDLMIQVPAKGMCKLCRTAVCKEIWRKS